LRSASVSQRTNSAADGQQHRPALFALRCPRTRVIVVNKPLQKERRGKGEYRLVTTKNGKSRQITAAPFVVDKNIKGQDRGQPFRGKEKILESTRLSRIF
jgi:hypothetical protein